MTATTDGKGYVCDGNGNMAAGGTRSFAWNYDNQPVTIVSGGVATTFKYDGDGVRVKKSSPAGTRIYIDNLHEVSAGVGGNFIYAGNTRVAVKHPGQVLYYHQDHLGSTGVVTGADGLVQEKIFYRPFGESVEDSGLLSVNHKFTGQEFDDETDLYFYNARYYNPKLGRFISADTIVPDATNPQYLNRYSYAINNPLRYIDPSGHESSETTTSLGITSGDTGGVNIGVNGDGNFGISFSWGGSSPTGNLSSGESYDSPGGSDGGWSLQNTPSFPQNVYDIGYTRYRQFVNPSAFGEGQSIENGMLVIEMLAIPLTGLAVSAERALAAKGVPLLRQQYVEAVSELKPLADSLRVAGGDAEQIARALHSERRAIGEQFKALTPPDKLAEVYQRNLQKYGDRLGPTIDWLRTQGKSWDQIIDSATRTGGKDLGF